MGWVKHLGPYNGKPVVTFSLANDFLARTNAMRAQLEEHQSSQRTLPQDCFSSIFIPPHTGSSRLSAGSVGSLQIADGFTSCDSLKNEFVVVSMQLLLVLSYFG
ncbi:uncharacterized protein LOC143025219 [Oratosquilla oratoria]|uniref:uncharacterized protein LOC143025219 n=1 Tax=Oratosquilla oratoria TaxID=337810 RepID=UPI003F771647